MSNYKIKSILLGFILLTQLIYSQNFVDDLYYNDSEVNYDFLYTEDNLPTEDFLNDSINDYRWDDDISYENRMRKFNNSYYLDYYWDYGWHSPTWYNWSQPTWGWSLNYHNYGWGLGLNYGSSWHSPYNYWNYGWHSPWYYGHHHWNNFYYPGHYGYYGGLNNYVISTGYQNISYGHRATNNTNINYNNTPQRSRINLANDHLKPSKNIEKPEQSPVNNIVEKIKHRVSPQKKYTQDNRANNYNANKKNNKSNNNNSYQSSNRNQKINSNRPNRSSRSNSNRNSGSNSNRGKRN